MRYLLPIIICLYSSRALADEAYPNFDIYADGRGGYSGTHGAQNFDIDVNNGVSGQIGGQQPNVRIKRRGLTPGNVGATQGSCVVDGNDMAYCR